MADRNLNNWEYPLLLNLTAGAATMDIANAAAVRLQDEVFTHGDTAVLTLFEGADIEAVRVSARTIDGGGTGIARLTIDARGVEEVSETAAAGTAFNALTTTVRAGTTAGQIQTIRDASGGGSPFTFYEYTTSGTKNVDLDTNPLVHITNAPAGNVTINFTTPAVNSRAYRAVVTAAGGGSAIDIDITIDGAALTDTHPNNAGSLPFSSNDVDWFRASVEVWRNSSGTIYSAAVTTEVTH